MDNQIIRKRLQEYKIISPDTEEDALKEILQEITLHALSTTDFFSKAFFQGGTALRILYNLPRFSEDLDFILKKPDAHFQWQSYIEEIKKALALYGITPEIQDRTESTTAVKKLFLKDNSIGKILDLKFTYHHKRKLLIKLEIDTNPPAGSQGEIKYLKFPTDYAIVTQSLPSNFAGKCHALLCRHYSKSRDWFDLSWYVTNEIQINFEFLENAINQNGPWQNQNLKITKKWLIDMLKKQIHQINWEQAKLDIIRFVSLEYKASINLWGVDFFTHKLQLLESYL